MRQQPRTRTLKGPDTGNVPSSRSVAAVVLRVTFNTPISGTDLQQDINPPIERGYILWATHKFYLQVARKVENQLAATVIIAAAAAICGAGDACAWIDRGPFEHLAFDGIKTAVEFGIGRANLHHDGIFLKLHSELGVLAFQRGNVLFAESGQDFAGVLVAVVDNFAEGHVQIAVHNGGIFVHGGLDFGKTGIIVFGGVFIVAPMRHHATVGHTIGRIWPEAVAIPKYPEKDKQKDDDTPDRRGVRASRVVFATVKHKEAPYRFI